MNPLPHFKTKLGKSQKGVFELYIIMIHPEKSIRRMGWITSSRYHFWHQIRCLFFSWSGIESGETLNLSTCRTYMCSLLINYRFYVVNCQIQTWRTKWVNVLWLSYVIIYKLIKLLITNHLTVTLHGLVTTHVDLDQIHAANITCTKYMYVRYTYIS